jgi:hypothetical protein
MALLQKIMTIIAITFFDGFALKKVTATVSSPFLWWWCYEESNAIAFFILFYFFFFIPFGLIH